MLVCKSQRNVNGLKLFKKKKLNRVLINIGNNTQTEQGRFKGAGQYYYSLLAV